MKSVPAQPLPEHQETSSSISRQLLFPCVQLKASELSWSQVSPTFLVNTQKPASQLRRSGSPSSLAYPHQHDLPISAFQIQCMLPEKQGHTQASLQSQEELNSAYFPFIWHLSHWSCSGWGSSWKSTEYTGLAWLLYSVTSSARPLT